MSRGQEPIHIAFGIDDAYSAHLAVTIASVIANAPADQAFVFHVAHGGVSAANQRRVQACAPRATFHWRLIDRSMLPPMTGVVIDHLSPASFNRLLLPRIVEADRLIYLDSDLVVVSDITALWRVDLKGRALGAVPDALADPVAFAARWKLPVDAGCAYFNSGVLLIDLKLVRETGSFDTALKLLAQSPDKAHFADQCGLNAAFWNAWTPLDGVWNVQRAMATQVGEAPCAPELVPASKRRPRIIHYTSNRKPWLRTAYHPYAGAYWDYLAKTPYVAEVTASSGVSLPRRWAWRARWWANAARLSLAP